jgi:transcriptional regulator with XRE-family HTH domain
VRQSSVSQWERGITGPKTKHLLLLLRLFGVVLVRVLVIEQATSGTEPGDREGATDRAAHTPT